MHICLCSHVDPITVAALLHEEDALTAKQLRYIPGVPVQNLAASYIAAGHQVTLISCIESAPRDQTLRGERFTFHIIKSRPRNRCFLDNHKREVQEILNVASEAQADIYHAHWTQVHGLAFSKLRQPKVLTIHDAAKEYARYYWMIKHPLNNLRVLRWVRNTHKILRSFDDVIAVSPFVEDYIRLKHRSNGRIHVIPNFIPNYGTPPAKSPKKEAFVFGVYGDPSKLKNVAAVLEAFRLFSHSQPKAALHIFGSGWDTLIHHYKDLNVTFRGSLPHQAFLKALATDIDTLIHPSLIEAHPLTICEATRMGLPVIAGHASGGVSWTLDYGRGGQLVDVNNPLAIKAAMEETLRSPELAKAKQAYHSAFIDRHFSETLIRSKHEELYNEIVKRHSAVPGRSHGK